MPKNLKIILISLWVVVGVAVGGVAAGVWWYRQRQNTAAIHFGLSPDAAEHRLDVLFDSPVFTLTDQDAKPFDSKSLRGKIWVADFVFTGCSSYCPLMTQQMAEFQKQTVGSEINMVSFSVDPVNDTPAVLMAYTLAARADLSRWHFLTGGKDDLWKISNQMKLAVGDGDNHQLMHSTHFLLVDRDGHVRGIYDYKDAGFLKRLVEDAKTLAR
jgi:protein SCO1/2